MSVRVNLLPGEVRDRGRASRTRSLAALVGVVLLLGLAGLSLLQRGSIGDAEERLAAVEAQNQQLQADIGLLQPFADLEARAQASVDVVGFALADEASVAAILQDLSTVLPPNAEIDTLTVTLADPSAPATGGERLVFGRIGATGRVLDGLAPGVERLIIDLDRVAAFENVFVTTSTVDAEGVASFSLEAELGLEVLTGRYGLVASPTASEVTP